MGPKGCPETSVRNYQYSLPNNLEQRSFRRVLLIFMMGPICCPETSVRNYHYSLRNNLEERSFDEYSFYDGADRLSWNVGT
jgi:hypothetical protein